MKHLAQHHSERVFCPRIHGYNNTLLSLELIRCFPHEPNSWPTLCCCIQVCHGLLGLDKCASDDFYNQLFLTPGTHTHLQSKKSVFFFL